MNPLDVIQNFENGKLKTASQEFDLTVTEWNAHPTFNGVFLKHLVTSIITQGEVSCHLVKIEPGCEIGSHTHETNLEIHEVISGKGIVVIDGQTYDYFPGDIGVISKQILHKVQASEDGLVLLAKFTPALV